MHAQHQLMYMGTYTHRFTHKGRKVVNLHHQIRCWTRFSREIPSVKCQRVLSHSLLAFLSLVLAHQVNPQCSISLIRKYLSSPCVMWQTQLLPKTEIWALGKVGIPATHLNPNQGIAGEAWVFSSLITISNCESFRSFLKLINPSVFL